MPQCFRPFVVLSLIAACATTRAEDAAAILADTGVQGGLVVHLGCGDGTLTTALRVSDRYVVHGLDTDPPQVAAARRRVQAERLEGAVSVAGFDGRHLPYIDNLVNLIVAEEPGEVPSEELMRILAPRGVAYLRGDDGWDKIVKPVPREIDEWTHYLHSPDNNAVAQDERVGVPFHVQWVGDPKWARHHNHLSSTSAMVSAGGRLFAIVDEGPIASLALPPEWRLVARDAFNGVVLWKKRVGPWEGVLRPFRSGPTDLSRRLVAVDDRVYVTLGYTKPVVALDAATGDVVQEYSQTAGASEILCDGTTLYVIVGEMSAEQYVESRRRGKSSPPPRNKRLLAIDPATGNTKWQKSDADTSELLPTTLCVTGESAYFQNPSHVVCLDAATGQQKWQAPRAVRTNRLAWSTPTLVVYGDVLLSADCAAPSPVRRAGQPHNIKWTVTAKPENNEASVGQLIAFSTRDGKELWRCPTAQGYNAPADVLVADGLVWASYAPGRNTPDLAEGRDLHTGEIKRRLKTEPAFTETHHHRCYRNKATDRFILLGRTGVEFIELSGEKPVRHCWVRGACQYGVMPANGLLYAPPHACACYIQSKLSGLWALASQRSGVRSERLEVRGQKSGRLEKGPAYGKVDALQSEVEVRGPSDVAAGTPHSAFRIPHSTDWPTYRHDAGRTGRTASSVPESPQHVWRAKLGGRLTSPVIGTGKLLVAGVDRHEVHALDAVSGQRCWEFVAGGRIDSPPTIADGMAVFGCADGYVYALRLADGEFAWRFRAAPVDRRTVAFGQVESVWPVTGSVLIREGVVYCTAGRSSFLDGGMYLYRLDLPTGRLIGSTRFDSRDPETGEQPEEIIEDVELPGALPDVLLCDGKYIFLRDKMLDIAGVEQPGFAPHLYSSAGLLDDSWWHRTYWLWGGRTWGRASGWHVMPGIRPSGRLLVADEETVFGYGRKTVRGSSLQGYHLFRASKQVETLDRPIKNNNVALAKYQKPAKVKYFWSQQVPLVARAMVLADDTLLAAGPVMAPATSDGREPTFDASSPATLMAFRAEDGSVLSRCKLPTQPVFDGMAVAGGRIYMATVDGNVVCLGTE